MAGPHRFAAAQSLLGRVAPGYLAGTWHVKTIWRFTGPKQPHLGMTETGQIDEPQIVAFTYLSTNVAFDSLMDCLYVLSTMEPPSGISILNDR